MRVLFSFRYFISGGLERLIRILILQKRNYVRQAHHCLELYISRLLLLDKKRVDNIISDEEFAMSIFSLWAWSVVLLLNAVRDTLTKQW